MGLMGKQRLRGSSPFPLFSLCSSSSAGALTSSPWASPGWLPPLSAVAPERRPLQGQGAAVRGEGVPHIPEVTPCTLYTHAWEPGSLLFAPIRLHCAFAVLVFWCHQNCLELCVPDALWALPCASLVSLGEFPFRSLISHSAPCSAPAGVWPP